MWSKDAAIKQASEEVIKLLINQARNQASMEASNQEQASKEGTTQARKEAR
jgi:hypothetical protein